MKKIVPSSEVLTSITSTTHSDSTIVSYYLVFIEPMELLLMASKDPNMSKQGTAGKRKHITL